MKFSRVGKNARLGDGGLTCTHKNAHATFYSTELQILGLKREMCLKEGIEISDLKTQLSGYGGTKTIYRFGTRVNEALTDVYDASIDDVINDIDEEDLILWYLDDGSWHKSRNTMHLYCNMFDDRETELLAVRIEEMYGVKPVKRIDRKKDGREFNYLYFPRHLVAIFRPIVKRYIVEKGLTDFFYKVGGIEFEDILESVIHLRELDNFVPAYRSWTGARRVDKSAYMVSLHGIIYVNWTNKDKHRQTKFLMGA
ncbi:hypothetical protein M3626_20885 [Psychrobacillus sp. MER TA 17]|nr:hypothetical protein [Psychrobacillus sp. MER TA 17]